jgi:hypothetical protein
VGTAVSTAVGTADEHCDEHSAVGTAVGTADEHCGGHCGEHCGGHCVTYVSALLLRVGKYNIQVTDALKARQMLDDTLIVWTTDNGGRLKLKSWRLSRVAVVSLLAPAPPPPSPPSPSVLALTVMRLRAFAFLSCAFLLCLSRRPDGDRRRHRRPQLADARR